jgi:hypothetical protein
LTIRYKHKIVEKTGYLKLLIVSITQNEEENKRVALVDCGTVVCSSGIELY